MRPLAAAISIALNAGYGEAAPPLPTGTLPVPQANWVSGGQATRAQTGTTLTINQATPKAVLNWQSFNIANGSAVKFVQPNAASATLNRIADANPSVIQGQLSANGQIYLINQNGIIFDRGAQLNVGSLVGSTLNITDELFNNGILTNPQPSQIAAFSAFPNGLPSGFVVVESGAQINADPGGRVMLLAPSVSNNGVIRSPDGQTILAAGAKIYLAASADPGLRGLLVEVDNGGTAVNQSLGQIIAQRGNATLVGLAVNQSGRVTATTSVNVNGSIRLIARDTVVDRILTGGVVVPEGSHYGSVTLASGSVTQVAVDSGDEQTIKDNQAFNRSRIDIAGKTIELQSDSTVIAPSGNIALTAQSGFDFQQAGQPPATGVRIYLAQGSVIDAAGSSDVEVPAERNSIAVELRGNELRDAPLQRDGFLRGKTVYIDARKATPLADVSGYIDQLERGVGERTTTGGAVSLKSEGDVVLRSGSVIDVSGGSTRYLDGTVRTTRLLSQGRVIDIGDATSDQIYNGFADSFTVEHQKWGFSRTFVSPFASQFTAGYIQGANAGSISMLSYGLVLDGELRARTAAGPYQRGAGAMPLGGKLTIGDAAQSNEVTADFRTSSVAFAMRTAALPANFSFGDPLPASFADQVQLPISIFAAGFNRV
ncbi:MAG: filamentous hemagglutinin N-terminal domain-containing protein, partial [Betaproteobacteria bacterium]